MAVISPFLDRSHGTERCIVEQLERFPIDQKTEIHIYAQQVRDLHGLTRYRFGKAAQPGNRLLWHKVPSIPAPHLMQYIFWFLANTICRWWDEKYRGLKYDIVYSPGINATDADTISVHIVFHEFYRRVLPQLSFRKTPVAGWLRLIHRRLYYRLVMALETRVYRRPKVALAAISALGAQQLEKHFQRSNTFVIRYGVDAECFSLSQRLARRTSAREQFALSPEDFTLLLIGNDWKNKGLDALLQALANIRELPWKLLVVGSDLRTLYEKLVLGYGMLNQISFLAPSPDVMQFYAAADAYVGPSLEDAYGLPILEAMACGLPVIVSSRAGASEIIRDGMNGIILRDPQNARELATALRSLMENPNLCRQLGEQASLTAQQHTWSRNAQATWDWLNAVLQEKNRLAKR